MESSAFKPTSSPPPPPIIVIKTEDDGHGLDGGGRSLSSVDNGRQEGAVENGGRSKTDKIKEVVEKAASDDSKMKIEKLLDDVHQLSDLEKLLLYLRLPTGATVEVDPLKQSFISSLGNRYEVTQTVTWIQTHLEEDNEVSLPKQEVYDGYCEFCRRVKMKPLSTADFGKVMKQVFPGVRPRRLGTRGNSRYCYAGLRKKLLLGSPQLPDLSLTHEETCEDGDASDPELTGVSSHLVREWAEKLLGQKFSNLRELACHLVENAYVNNRSVAAFTLLSYLSSNGLGKRSQSCILMNQCAGNKHRETQLQLQRKLQERELIREQKKKLLEQRSSHAASYSRSPAPSEIKERKSQLSKARSMDEMPRTSFSPSSLENGTRSKVFDFEDSAASKKKNSCEEKTWSSSSTADSPKKTKAIRRDETPVRSFQAKPAMSASTSPQPRLVETMRSRSSSDCVRQRYPSTSCVTSGGERQRSTKCGHCVPELIRSSSLGCSPEAAHKTGKVRIPRVKSNGGGGGGGSKMTCLTPASIIIFPQISEYNRSSPGSQSKPKYKPIQPKPIDTCTGVSDEGSCKVSKATVVVGGGGGPSTVTDAGQRNGRSSSATGSQPASASDVKSASRDSPVSTTTTNPKIGSTGTDRGPPYRDGSKGGNRRKQMKRTSGDTKRKPNANKNKRRRVPSLTVSVTGADKKKDAVGAVASPEEEMSISTLENDAWMEYLEGSDVPSVDQEDELFHYFGGDDVLSPIKKDFTSGSIGECANSDAQSTELSQLRRLLERNLQRATSSTRDDQFDDKPAVASSDSIPTLRLLLSSTTRQHQRHPVTDGDGITPDSCLSHASSRMVSPNLTMSETKPSTPMPAQYFVSTTLSQEEDLRSRDVDAGLVLEASMDYVQDISREDMWSSQESYGGVLCKTATGNSEEPMFSSSDSNSGCHVGSGNGSFPSTAAHSDDRSTLGDLGGGGGGVSGIEFRPYNGGYYKDNYVPSQQQQFPVQAQPTTGCQSQSSSVPPSPNTRRRAFNFMPISPRSTPVPETCSSATHSASHSPFFCGAANNAPSSGCGHVTARSIVTHTAPSLSASTATSPFVSPRSTPSSHCRSRQNSGQQMQVTSSAAVAATTATSRATQHSLLYYSGEQQLQQQQQQQQPPPPQQQQQQHLSMATMSSPFASPHPTPVPFSKSRHNSSQNLPRIGGAATALLYASSATRTRHASDVGLMSMMLTSPEGSAPLSPLNLHKEMDSATVAAVMRSRHNSNSSIPPNSPAASSAPMSPMVHCPIQEVFSPGYAVVASQQQQQRHFHPTSDLERMSLNDDGGGGGSDYHPNYRQHVSQDVDTRTAAGLHPCTSWPVRQQPQMDPRLASRQRHASMGATVHHHPLPPPPRPRPTADAIATFASTSAIPTTSERDAKKPSLPQVLSPLDAAAAASRCRSVPIYQMLENAIQQPEISPPTTTMTSSSPSTHVDSTYNMISKSYPATPIGQQQSFSFDPRMTATADYSPMIDGKTDNPVTAATHTSHSAAAAAASNGDALEMPPNEFQDMLNTTLEDLTYDDDISKFAQELEQYTGQ